MDEQHAGPGGDPATAPLATVPPVSRRPRWRPRRPRVLVGVAVVAVAVVAVAVVGVVTVRSAAADPSTGLLRLAHLSPATPAVDVYATGPRLPPTRIASGVSYQGVSPYLAEPAGAYTLQARPAGAAPDSPPAISVSVEIPAGTAQTAAFIDGGVGSAMQMQVLDDETAPAPAGTGMVRVVQGADVGPLDVTAVGGPTLARDLFYGSSTPYVSLPAHPWGIAVASRAGATASRVIPVASTSVNSLFVTRGVDGKLAVIPVLDAGSAPVSPAPGAPPVPVPPPSAGPDTSTPLPGAPKVPSPPRGGIGAGAGGLAPRSIIDDLFGSGDSTAPPAPRMPEADATAPPPGGPRPVGLTIPAVNMNVPTTTDLRIDYRGELQVPTDFGKVGWYTDSAVPGDPGPAVLVGHVDTRRGPAVFADLDHLRPGDPIDVARSDGGTAHFRVDGVAYYPKDTVPTQSVYGPRTNPQLRLLTCGGPFDAATLSYRDNLVVYASSR